MDKFYHLLKLYHLVKTSTIKPPNFGRTSTPRIAKMIPIAIFEGNTLRFDQRDIRSEHSHHSSVPHYTHDIAGIKTPGKRNHDNANRSGHYALELSHAASIPHAPQNRKRKSQPRVESKTGKVVVSKTGKRNPTFCGLWRAPFPLRHLQVRLFPCEIFRGRCLRGGPRANRLCRPPLLRFAGYDCFAIIMRNHSIDE